MVDVIVLDDLVTIIFVLRYNIVYLTFERIIVTGLLFIF